MEIAEPECNNYAVLQLPETNNFCLSDLLSITYSAFGKTGIDSVRSVSPLDAGNRKVVLPRRTRLSSSDDVAEQTLSVRDTVAKRFSRIFDRREEAPSSLKVRESRRSVSSRGLGSRAASSARDSLSLAGGSGGGQEHAGR